ncbi:histidine phosphatase family protein [Halobacillus shinanisalinarum]|uniref:Histidine phosphatase family protein n=1 Tax=Halobacillus shinanisalinarum TaxID=2932258 RepID=A0ABY4H2A5_9BACI|nr:histidine phosphatase family protein [Halobacillus shinanisalinarum]UOQ94311.1 histidine phosphatase family protein [Halobacillus shinanisalinarum]
MTTLGLIRHGSTPWNQEKRAQGNSDIPLDDQGIREAQKLADRLFHESWEIIYSSPLKRAKQTAEVIAERLDIDEIDFDQRIKEVAGGQIEGTTEDERIEKWGDDWRDLDLGIEQQPSVIKRGTSFIKEIIEKHPNQRVLIVSHGSFIGHLVQVLDASFKEDKKLDNTSVTTLNKADEKWICDLYNCTKHLAY